MLSMTSSTNVDPSMTDSLSLLTIGVSLFGVPLSLDLKRMLMRMSQRPDLRLTAGLVPTRDDELLSDLMTEYLLLDLSEDLGVCACLTILPSLTPRTLGLEVKDTAFFSGELFASHSWVRVLGLMRWASRREAREELFLLFEGMLEDFLILCVLAGTRPRVSPILWKSGILSSDYKHFCILM